MRSQRTLRGRGAGRRWTARTGLAVAARALAVLVAASAVLMMPTGAEASGSHSVFPNRIEAGESTLVRAGQARKTYGIIDLYDYALYVTPEDLTGDAVLSGRAASAMRFSILSSLVGGRLPERIRALADATFTPAEADRFDDFHENLVAGDIVTVHYSPGEGTVLDLNGGTVLVADGFAFMEGVLREWLSSDHHGRTLMGSLREQEGRATGASRVESVDGRSHELIPIPAR